MCMKTELNSQELCPYPYSEFIALCVSLVVTKKEAEEEAEAGGSAAL